LLFGFWRELAAFGGPLEMPLRRLPALLPWSARFAAAAFQRARNTRHLAPIVRPSVDVLESLLTSIGRRDLLKRHGHYEVWLGDAGAKRARAQADGMRALGIHTETAPAELLGAVRGAASASAAAGLWFPGCAHVVDPLEVVRAFATAAEAHGATILQREVRALHRSAEGIDIETSDERIPVSAAVVCCGVWSADLLRPFGVKVPLEAARGYHVEIPDHAPLADAPILYSNERVLITPMTGRLRASSFMEFREPGAPPDERKPARLRRVLAGLGYPSGNTRTSWVGSRPVLPDYLPAIGRLADAPGVFYAFGHQHIGLTLAAVTAELVAALVAGREPQQDIAPFAIERFSRR
jgi:D-amino-acid dehydrogenase